MGTRAETMAAEIAEAEKQIFSKPTPKTGKATEDKVEEVVEAAPVSEETTVTQQQAPLQEEKAVTLDPTEQEDFKKRFANFKASADATIHGQRQVMVKQDEDLQEVRKQLHDLKLRFDQETVVDPYKDLYTKEERDLVGSETIDLMQKTQQAVIDSKLKPLQEQLELERKERLEGNKRRLAREQEDLNQTFLTKLERIVPEFRVHDKDPKFAKWMESPDEASGYPRINIFKSAQTSGDVGRVAGFFQEYIKAITPVDRLAGKVTPIGDGAGPSAPQQQQKPTDMTMKDIIKFYDTVSSGRYRGTQKQQQAMETKIDNHLRKMGMDRKG